MDHALYGHVDRTRRYSVGQWLADFRRVRDGNPGRLLIVVGGTGLYFNALLNGLSPIPEVSEDVRREALRIRESEGLASLVSDLLKRDPDTAKQTDLANPARVARAWEVYKSTGRGLAHWHRQATAPVLEQDAVAKLLVWPTPETTAAKIRLRLDRMVAEGVVEECREALEGWNPELPYSKALGAREFKEHLDGKIGLEETLDRVAQATTNYAKRQRTWFRSRMAGWRRIEPETSEHADPGPGVRPA